jgi:nucleoside diphosphate kinase
MKQDVYRVQQDVMTFATNQLSTLKTLVNNSVDVVRNQYSGQVDTHNSDINDIRSDFNNNTYIRDAANQNDWATRIVTLMDSIEATRVNVQTAINNNK